MVGEKKNSEGQRSPSCFCQPLSRLAATAPRSGSLLVQHKLNTQKAPFGAFSYALLFFSQLCLVLYAFPYAAAYHYGPGLVVADIEAHTVGNVAVADALEPGLAAVYHVHRQLDSDSFQFKFPGTGRKAAHTGMGTASEQRTKLYDEQLAYHFIPGYCYFPDRSGLQPAG